jgi:hypothetical protein
MENSNGNNKDVVPSWWKRLWTFVIIPQHSNAVVAVFSGLLFLATLVYTVFAGLQWDITKRALQADQRAWLLPNLISFNIEPQKPPVAEFIIQNTGKTPALNLNVVFRMELLDPQAAPRFDYSPPLITGGGGPVLFPNAPYAHFGVALLHQIEGANSVEPMPLTEPLLSKWNNRELMFVVYGRLEYRDNYGTDHWAKFCFHRVNLPNNAFSGSTAPLAMRECSDYNDVDRN